MTFELRVSAAKIVLNTLDLGAIKDLGKRRELMVQLNMRASDLVSKAGLSPRRSGYRNSLLFPAAAVARLFRKRNVSRERARSDVKPVPRIVNACLSGVLAIERRWRRSFPFGLSVFCVAEKPELARDTIRAPAPPPAPKGWTK